MEPDQLPLRERKKLRTRNALIAVTDRLIVKQGYDETTLEQICDEVEISIPTLLAYFPSKDRLALARNWENVEQIRSTLQDPTRDADTLTIWRGYIEAGSAWAQANKKGFIAWTVATQSSPALRKAKLEVVSALELALTEGLALDCETDPRADLPTMLLATMLTFGNQRVLDQWVDGGGESDLTHMAVAVVDFAIERFPRPGTGSFVAHQ
jgi:AcrR family transcriptional regulator